MKTKSLFLISVLILGSFTKYCISQTEINPTNMFRDKVTIWIDRHIAISTDSLSTYFLNQLKDSIDWSDPVISFNSNKEQQITFNLNVSVKSYKNSSYFIATENRKGEIRESHIINLNPNADNTEVIDNRIVSNLLNAKQTSYSGMLTELSILNNFIFQLEIKKGNLYSQKYIAKDVTKKIYRDNKQGLNKCTNWNWINTIYYSKENIQSNKRFAFSTCPNSECDQVKIVDGISFRINCNYPDGGIKMGTVDYVYIDTSGSKKLHK